MICTTHVRDMCFPARACVCMHAQEAARVVWAFLTANDERDVQKVLQLLTIVSSENGGRAVCSNASVRETEGIPAELFEEPKVSASAIGKKFHGGRRWRPAVLR